MPDISVENEFLPLLSQLIDLRRGRSAGHQLEIAELARRISLQLGHTPNVAQEIYVAALLCHIGFIALPDLLIKTPYRSLSPENRNRVDQSAIEGAAILASTSFLNVSAEYVKHQYERFDGKGFPDGLAGRDIPIGSRIIAIVVDFDDLQNGSYFGTRLNRQQAKAKIVEDQGNNYDPQYVAAFSEVIKAEDHKAAGGSEVIVPFDNLKLGMILSQDVLMPNGIILLRKGKPLTGGDIESLGRVNNLYPSKLQIYIQG